jgi:transposase, IS5 family
MSRRQSQDGLAEAFMHPTLGRNAELEALAKKIDWISVETLLSPLRSGRRGAPPYPALMMLKALLLQQWWRLSDPGLEEALRDRLSFRRFVGLSADQAAPDHATLWRFRQALAEAGLERAVFETINAQLATQGLVVKAGTMIDASLIEAQSVPPKVPDPRALEPGASKLVRVSREPEADWTRRGAKRVFGYKLHVAMDRGSGLVRAARLTPASRNETLEADGLMQGDEREVWADKAYDSNTRSAALKARGIKNRICRRANKHHRLSHWAERRNALIGQVRGQVETVFAVLKRHYGHGRARYLTLRRNQTDLLFALIAMNLRRALVLTS